MTLATGNSRQIDSDLWTLVSPCRPVGMQQDTEVVVQLVFNDTSSEPVPEITEIVDTLVVAVSAPNSTFTLPVDPNSITVVGG